MNRDIGMRCMGHGVYNTKTAWKAVDVPHCHGTWQLTEGHKPEVCYYSVEDDDKRNFIFLWTELVIRAIRKGGKTKQGWDLFFVFIFNLSKQNLNQPNLWKILNEWNLRFFFFLSQAGHQKCFNFSMNVDDFCHISYIIIVIITFSSWPAITQLSITSVKEESTSFCFKLFSAIFFFKMGVVFFFSAVRA